MSSDPPLSTNDDLIDVKLSVVDGKAELCVETGSVAMSDSCGGGGVRVQVGCGSSVAFRMCVRQRLVIGRKPLKGIA